jgi:hypothetical protein
MLLAGLRANGRFIAGPRRQQPSATSCAKLVAMQGTGDRRLWPWFAVPATGPIFSSRQFGLAWQFGIIGAPSRVWNDADRAAGDEQERACAFAT